jgi:hypothetical protein
MAHPTRIFNNELELSKAWEEFKADLQLQANEWVKVQYVGKDGQRVEEKQKVPYTFEGFKRFCRKNYGEVEQYFTNQDGYYNDFIGICRAIKEEIRENQIVGGLLNFYNPSITQRLNGLVDKTETEVTLKKPPIDLDKLSDTTLDELIAALPPDGETD